MSRYGWMVFMVAAFLLAGLNCTQEELVWPVQDSYILSTDGVSKIFVHDNQGAVLATLLPLQDSMKGISSPTLVNSGAKVVFTTYTLPDSFKTLVVVDQAGNLVYTYEGLGILGAQGSPTRSEICYTLNSARVYILPVGESDEQPMPRTLFTDEEVKSSVSGTVRFNFAVAPVFSPDGEQVAFINEGLYTDSLYDSVNDKWAYIDKNRTDVAVVNRDGTGYSLITGNLAVGSIPISTSWLTLEWSHDGKWLYAVSKSEGRVGTVYVLDVENQEVTPITRPCFSGYSYFRVSPTGDTVLLGTKPNSADLYVVGASDNYIGYDPQRLTNSLYFDQPYWGPGGGN
jgi:Tol biopolymer transport system component